MSLLQKCLETYDNMEHLVAKKVEGKATLAPIGHTILKCDLKITVNEKGKFVNAEKFSDRVLVPYTIKSKSRTSGCAPHPLCDKAAYIVPGLNDERHTAYVNALKNWVDSDYSNEILKSIYRYVVTGDIQKNLNDSGFDSEFLKKNPNIVWNIVGFGKNDGLVSDNEELQNKYAEYYLQQMKAVEDKKKKVCMVTGEKVVCMGSENKDGTITEGIKVLTSASNAKLISSNDTRNFTYRGRFRNATEACAIGAIEGEKAHNALKWIIANNRIPLPAVRKSDGGENVLKTLVAWNPRGNSVPRIDSSLSSFFPELKEQEELTPSEYTHELKQKIYFYTDSKVDDEVVVAIVDAATHNHGRLAIAYYSEFPEHILFRKMEKWDNETMVVDSYGKIKHPSFYDYICFSTSTYDKSAERFRPPDRKENKIVELRAQKLLECKLNGKPFPRDVMQKLCENASRLYLYDKKTKKRILATAHAAIRKYHIDNYKEDVSMSLEEDKKDRSYQYGRLLAVLERIEEKACEKKEKSDKGRETNAIRAQHQYVLQPLTTVENIIKKLKVAYYPKLTAGNKIYFDKMINEIMDKISKYDNLNDKLDEMYIVGYCVQRNAFFAKKENNEYSNANAEQLKKGEKIWN